MFYFSGDGNWWMGLSDGNALSWHLASNTKGFVDLLDGKHRVTTGDFNGDGKTDVAFYYSGDGNWWIGLSDGNTLSWHIAGNTRGFGNLLDGSHAIYDGDFDGDGKSDALFYYNGDGNWWLGLSDGNALSWRLAGNTQGFGNLIDGSHRLLPGDFDGDGKRDLLFHYNGDGNWWMGRFDGGALSWHYAGTSSGFGDLLDLDHRLYVGDFDGDGKSDVFAYRGSDGSSWIGRSDGNALGWHAAGNSGGFGNLLDPSRMLFFGDYDGDHKTDALFYYSGDGNWWLGASNGDSLGWRLAGNTVGFGNLTR